MTNIETNKAFVRTSIPDEQQQEFLNYFQCIQDHENFAQWPLSKMQEIVKAFKLLKNQFSFNPDGYVADQIYRDNVVQVKPKEQGFKGSEQTQYKSSLNYLQEIEKTVELNSSNRQKEFKTNNIQNWFKIADLPLFESQKIQINTSQNPKVFQNFDELIKSIKVQQNSTPTEPSLLIRSTSKQYTSKRSKQKQFQTNNSKVSDRVKDKLFKWKICQIIKCKKQIEQLNCEDVIIQNHEMVHRIFLPDYALYHIKILPSNIICKRNYHDFVSLRTILEKMYPGTIVPYLQNISWLSQSDIILIQKHKENLSIFLKKLIRHPILAKTKIVRDFVSIVEHKTIKQKLQIYEKRQFKSLLDMQNSNGEYQLNLSEEQYKKIQKMSKWNKFLENYFSSYNQLLQTLSTQLKGVQSTYTKLSNMSIQMKNKLTSLYQYGICQNQIKQSLESLFKEQQIYYFKKKKMIEFQIANFDELMAPLINDQKKNAQIVNNLQYQILKMNEKYIKRLQNEPQSPSTMSQTYKDLADKEFKESIWNESQNIKLLKYQISFLNTNILQQYDFFNKSLISKLSSNWQKIVERESQYAQVLRYRKESIHILDS